MNPCGPAAECTIRTAMPSGSRYSVQLPSAVDARRAADTPAGGAGTDPLGGLLAGRLQDHRVLAAQVGLGRGGRAEPERHQVARVPVGERGARHLAVGDELADVL